MRRSEEVLEPITEEERAALRAIFPKRPRTAVLL
jgi:hypothetical protein